MLRKIRVTLAVLLWLAITAMILDFTDTLHHWFGWMAKIQAVPAIMALNLAIIIGLVVVTLLFGRIYCSIICPLGVYQDFVSHLSAMRRKKKKRFHHTKPLTALRLSVFVLFVIAIIGGFTAFASLIAPYSAYTRMVQNLLQPVDLWFNNLLAPIAEHYDSYAIYPREVWVGTLPMLIVAGVTFLVITVLAWRGGRIYCNAICPVGTLLGALSRYSFLRPVINTDKCINCGACARRCKSSCIDPKAHQIDLSRCVVCFDCIDECSTGAISFTRKPKLIEKTDAPEAKKAAEAKAATTTEANDAKGAKGADSSRRSFMIIGAATAGAAMLKGADKTVDGGLAEIEEKQRPNRSTRIVPAGAVSLKNFSQHCTACQLCVSKCPEGILRPEATLDGFMQPRIDYDRGYCRPECTTCSDVCPTGAIKPISWEDKSSTQIGHAVWIAKNCIVNTDGVECGNCARHCLPGAITMVPSDPDNPESPKIPAVDESRCIGCGACENLCPARPFSAIYVEGHEVHRTV